MRLVLNLDQSSKSNESNLFSLFLNALQIMENNLPVLQKKRFFVIVFVLGGLFAFCYCCWALYFVFLFFQ